MEQKSRPKFLPWPGTEHRTGILAASNVTTRPPRACTRNTGETNHEMMIITIIEEIRRRRGGGGGGGGREREQDINYNILHRA